jgi:hypothetical protein
MVVVGIPVSNIALTYPTAEYPRVTLNLHISGDVMVTCLELLTGSID